MMTERLKRFFQDPHSAIFSDVLNPTQCTLARAPHRASADPNANERALTFSVHPKIQICGLARAP